MDNILSINVQKKAAISQSNIRWTDEERKLLDQGRAACLDNLPLYQYQKEAILQKAKKDIEERKQIEAMRASIKYKS